MTSSTFLFLCAAVLLSLGLSLPLDDYVAKVDGAYGWSEISSWSGKWLGKGYSAHKLNLTSQYWLTDADFAANSDGKSLWYHIVVVIVPDEVKYTSNATLYITGGGMDTLNVEGSEDVMVAQSLAVGTGVVTGVLFMIPNEHITFAADPTQKSRTEDSIIAYTWDHFMKDPSKPEWLVRFPMVKASVKAMDCITEFANKKLADKKLSLDYYTVAGASKRGWTTWLVGAVDPSRVVGIVPIVLDAINFVDVIHHQYRSYDGWSFALADYLEMDIMSRIDTPQMLLLQQQEDPYFYKDRLTMPKLVVNAILDEFQQPDDNLYWWSDMPEPKHLMLVPNAEHSLATGILEAVPGIAAWLRQQLLGKRLPEMDWSIAKDGTVSLSIDSKAGLPDVEEVNAWFGYSCGVNSDTGVIRKDFRVINMDSPCKCGFSYDGNCLNLKSFFTKERLTSSGSDARGRALYSAHYDAPADGRYVAYFIEVTFKKHSLSPLDSASAPSSSAARRELSLVDKAKAEIEALEKKYEAAKDKAAVAKELYEAIKGSGGFPEIPLDLMSRVVVTTQVSVFPQTLPFADCLGSGEGTSTCTKVMR
jgi:PhoPQ-activated pathogenicity-related protein